MRIDAVTLVAEMKRRDWTQLKLAEEAGISRGLVSTIQNGKSCSDETGKKIAAALGLSVESLLEER